MAFRAAALTVAREGLELPVQAKSDADPTAQAAASSPPDRALSGLPPARNKGDRPWNVLAVPGTVTLRLTRPGMKWNSYNAAAVLSLVALRESGQWDRWWTNAAA